MASVSYLQHISVLTSYSSGAHYSHAVMAARPRNSSRQQTAMVVAFESSGERWEMWFRKVHLALAFRSVQEERWDAGKVVKLFLLVM